MHNFSGPVLESEFIQKLHRHLISRTEKNVAVYGMLKLVLELGLIHSVLSTIR